MNEALMLTRLNECLFTPTEERGDLLLVRNIWKHRTDCILDMRFTNLDAPFNIIIYTRACELARSRSLFSQSQTSLRVSPRS